MRAVSVADRNGAGAVRASHYERISFGTGPRMNVRREAPANLPAAPPAARKSPEG